MSAGTWLPKGTKKSWLLWAIPLFVDTVMCPDATGNGTVTAIELEVAEEPGADVKLNLSRSLAAFVSKFVPVIVTAVPGAPFGGVSPEIVGAPVPLFTVKELPLVAAPAGAVTCIVPVVAPDGIAAMSCVVLAEDMVAAVPLKETESWLEFALNPVPLIVTAVPTGPLLGVKSMMEICAEGLREIERMLPTASY